MLVTVFLHVRPEGHQEPHKEVEALSLAKDLVGFELETFQFWLPGVNPLQIFNALSDTAT